MAIESAVGELIGAVKILMTLIWIESKINRCMKLLRDTQDLALLHLPQFSSDHASKERIRSDEHHPGRALPT